VKALVKVDGVLSSNHRGLLVSCHLQHKSGYYQKKYTK
jgi:hypothetical protein